MGANIGGIYGAQLFRADDSPRYRRGFGVASAIVAFGVICAVCRFVFGDVFVRRYRWTKQKQSNVRGGHFEGGDGGEDDRGMRLSSEGVHGAALRVVVGFTGGGVGVDTAADEGGTEEAGESDVVVRESGGLCVVDSAGVCRSLETEIGVARWEGGLVRSSVGRLVS